MIGDHQWQETKRDRQSRGRLLRIAYIVIYGILFIIALFWSYLPQFPTCLFKIVTGYPCAGCGMTRAFVSAAQGQWRDAFQWHPVGLLFFIGFTGVVLAFLYELITNRFFPWDRWLLRWGKPLAWFALILLVVTWLLRLSFIAWGVWLPVPLKVPL
ncbi:MAG: DUF2752 domain-containing protein [Armatimonadetes bacterium]|nr:DUF2752 domain-containing protein [Armatimonadota bacterium]MDW8122652.1 DUF2752 domain-containing protein [Armatimonadota bacterium]